MRKHWGIAIIVGTLLLTGCAGATAEVTPTPTPTSEAATEAQVASVIAEHESDWREVIDEAAGCRLLWVTDPEAIEAATCYLREQSMVLTAQSAADDLRALDVPDSMSNLVDDMLTVLDAIGEVPLSEACGNGAARNDSDECTEAVGTLFREYVALENELDAWAPYL